MQQDNQQTYPYQADEIDLRKLAKSLKERRWFIFGFTGFVTLLAIVYVLLLPPPSISYIATTSFTKPSKSSFILNNDKIPSVTRESIYSSFLDNIIIESLQKKVFTEGDYLSRLNKQNELVGDVDENISGFLNSASLETNGALSTFSIQGTNAKILTDFLNDLQSRIHYADMQVKSLKAEKTLLDQNAVMIFQNFIMRLLEQEPKTAEKLAEGVGVKKEELLPFIERLEKSGKVKKQNDIYSLDAKKEA